ncbi:MAG: IclR family transcriptional regulator [Spirochaetales bacterium]|nr:IclR family transcriptional regulator [Spirochaetales bacterium]
MAPESDKYTIKAASRCFQILDYAVQRNGPISIQDVCTALSTNSNMAFRLLATLQSSGYMTKDPSTGLYSISLKTLTLSRSALQSLDIRRVTMPYLELLWNRFPRANVNMAVYYNGEILMLDRIDTQSTPRTYFTPGRQIPFHCTALGKVLVSDLSEEELDELIAEKGLSRYTERTITDVEKFKREIKKVRSEGVGRDRNEFIEGDNCTAVPIRGRDDRIVAAISLSALTSNMSVEEIEGSIPHLLDTAAKISYMMGCTTALSF